jgi:hypothetical protein
MERESAYINSFISRGREEGEVRAKRADLLRVIGRRLTDPVPEPIRLAIEGTSDTGVLDRWLDAAIDANDLADMRRAMNLEP